MAVYKAKLGKLKNKKIYIQDFYRLTPQQITKEFEKEFTKEIIDNSYF